MNPHAQSTFAEPGPSNYAHADPSMHSGAAYDASMSNYIVSPEMNTHMPLVSPSAHGHPHHHMHQPEMLPYQPMPQHMPQHPGPFNGSYLPVQQQQQQPQQPQQRQGRPGSPHMMGADVFGAGATPLPPSNGHMPANYDYQGHEVRRVSIPHD